MRLISANTPDAQVNPDLVIYPNGFIQANDVWLGSCELGRIVISRDLDAAACDVILTIYDGCVGDIGRAVRGGTGPDQDSYRVIAGAGVTKNGQGDPYRVGAPNAQLTACRKILDTYTCHLSANQSSIELPFEGIQCVMGCAIHLLCANGSRGQVSVAAQMWPHVTGATRANRASMPAPQGNFPL